MKLSKKVLLALIIAAALVASLWFYDGAKAPGHTDQPIDSSKPAAFDKSQHSLTDPNSIWVVVNKRFALPADYAPADLTVPKVPLRVPGNESMQLRREAAGALERMFKAAANQDLDLMLSSGYRPYSYQVGLYNSYVKSQGQAAADTFSARPGHSEHQTGLAADIEGTDRKCELLACFAATPQGQWLAANSYKYGFIIRYPKGLEAITGYEAEPWHIRYVGVGLSKEMHAQNVKTLEQFFGVAGGKQYSD